MTEHLFVKTVDEKSLEKTDISTFRIMTKTFVINRLFIQKLEKQIIMIIFTKVICSDGLGR